MSMTLKMTYNDDPDDNDDDGENAREADWRKKQVIILIGTGSQCPGRLLSLSLLLLSLLGGRVGTKLQIIGLKRKADFPLNLNSDGPTLNVGFLPVTTGNF